MASRGGATRPNGPNAGNKICQFKLVLLGESAVGKSSLVLRFVKGQFHEFQESTIGGTCLREVLPQSFIVTRQAKKVHHIFIIYCFFFFTRTVANPAVKQAF